MNVMQLHQEAIVIDAVSPLTSNGEHLDLYRAGGCTAVAPTVGGSGSAAGTFGELGRWLRRLEEREHLLLVKRTADIIRAKNEKKLGIIFHFQGTEPIEQDLDLVDAYKALGVGVIQLTYNVKNRVGDGCEERTDAGLSRFGIELVKRLNQAKIIVDCTHTGHRTTMDAIETSSAPVVFSHSNAYGVHPSARNIRDDQIKAVAATGGVIGLAGFPSFVSSKTRPTLDAFIDHAAYYADLVGIEHVGLGIDYFQFQQNFVSRDEAEEKYVGFVAMGAWSSSYPPPPYYYPSGIETPDKLMNLTARLLERGFKQSEVRGLLGGNWLRVYRAVWG